MRRCRLYCNLINKKIPRASTTIFHTRALRQAILLTKSAVQVGTMICNVCMSAEVVVVVVVRGGGLYNLQTPLPRRRKEMEGGKAGKGKKKDEKDRGVPYPAASGKSTELKMEHRHPSRSLLFCWMAKNEIAK